ncbi:MAG: SDR family NAD(P)-dependent oxidoreductase [Lentisphaeria bacterium]|nr:SDR family NAD(P)-dependent oxidoreductase [Lentisphaeria bacterium]
MTWKDKVAVVTGAGGTLCSEIAVDLAAKGMKVVLVGRTVEKLEKTAARIADAGGVCRIESGDVNDESSMQTIADKVAAAWGLCRILVNGAGGNNINALTTNTEYDPREITKEKPGDMRGFFDLDMELFKSVLCTNTVGTVIPCRVFARQMAEAGGGAILNFGSMNTYRPLSRIPAYAMSKAAVANFTQWLAAYLAPANIRVNAVAPGFFVNERSVKYLRTPDGGLSPRGENVMHHTPLKRFGEAKELLGCVEWLLDDDKAGFVTGITVPVDGGFLSSTGV